MDVLLTPHQERAVQSAFGNFEFGANEVKIGGFAGTGKTTVLAEVVHRLRDDDRVVWVACPTGRAALNLSYVGARTYHSLFYAPSHEIIAMLQQKIGECTDPKRLKELERDLKAAEQNPHFQPKPASLFVDPLPHYVLIDEASMVSEEVMVELRGFARELGFKIITFGDPMQLPPVKGADQYAIKAPDLMLTEVHRQAWDSAIIRNATAVRNGQTTGFEFIPGQFDWIAMRAWQRMLEEEEPDMIITTTNRKRRELNRHWRERLGFVEEGDDSVWKMLPRPGERLVCLRNAGDIMNGSRAMGRTGMYWDPRDFMPMLDLETDDDYLSNLWVPPDDFLRSYLEPKTRRGSEFGTYEEDIPEWEDAINQLPVYDSMQAVSGKPETSIRLDYGYCLTVHKAQGSQADHVCFFDQGWHRRQRQRMFYTAITRASDKFTWVRNPGWDGVWSS